MNGSVFQLPRVSSRRSDHCNDRWLLGTQVACTRFSVASEAEKVSEMWGYDPSCRAVASAHMQNHNPARNFKTSSAEDLSRPLNACSLTEWFTGLSREGPFRNGMSVRTIKAAIAGGRWSVCIPARNEAGLLSSTLAALGQAIDHVSEPGTVVLIANNTEDNTAPIFQDWAQSRGTSHVVASVDLADPIRNAAHARRLALDLGAYVMPTGVLLTTDADTRVAPDWIERNLAHLVAGAHLVCGRVDVDEHELASLPRPVRLCGDAEAAYFQRCADLWTAWTGESAPKLSVRAMGASLALTSETYCRAGRLPLPAVAEDKALAAAVRAQGLVILEAEDVRVTTSCRLDGRAAGGMSDALRERAYESDPYCDETLVPLHVLHARAAAWLGLAGTPDRCQVFEHLCQTDARLRSSRMHLSEVLEALARSQSAENSRARPEYLPRHAECAA
jgi:hypothetical protein